MTDAPTPSTTATSRRALLAGALGGIGAVIASALGSPRQAQAHDVDDVQLGVANGTATTTTIEINTSNSNHAFQGLATDGVGVFGSSNTSYGVRGNTSSGDGVLGYSAAGNGVHGFVDTGTGVYGYGNTGTGVYGNGDTVGVQGESLAKGVWGVSDAGYGIHGESTSGFAGYFSGKVFTSKFHEMKEIPAPGAPAADRARLFLRDDGSGKTQLCIRFSTGSVQVIARQP